MNEHYIGISGVIETNLSHNDFLDKFIEWVEDSGFVFCGSTREIDESGNPLEDNKKFIAIE